jgi:hypothetical protein
MRRAANIGFYLLVIACAIVLFVRFQGREAPAPPVAPAAPVAPPAAPPPAALPPAAPPEPGPPPRLAAPRPPATDGRGQRSAALDERALMQQLRALVKTEPQRAEALAREARRRFPDGADADERDALLVDALINQQRIGAARDETYYYYDRHPGGRFGEHLSIMTGVRPRPRGPGR